MRRALRDLLTDNTACPQIAYEERVILKDQLWKWRSSHPLSPELEANLWRTKESWSISAYARVLTHLLDGMSDTIILISQCLRAGKNPCTRESAAERLATFSTCVFKLAHPERNDLPELWRLWNRSWRKYSGSAAALSDGSLAFDEKSGVQNLPPLKWLRQVCKPSHAVFTIKTAKDDPYLTPYLASPKSQSFRVVLRTWDLCETSASLDPVIVFHHLNKTFPNTCDWARAFHALFPSQSGVERRVTVHGHHRPELLVLDGKFFSSPVGVSQKSCPTTTWILSKWSSNTEKFVATATGHTTFSPDVLLPPELDRHCPGIRERFLNTWSRVSAERVHFWSATESKLQFHRSKLRSLSGPVNPRKRQGRRRKLPLSQRDGVRE